MVRRTFTPAQANKTLPLVRRVVADILAKAAELRRCTARTQRTEAQQDEIDALEVELRELMRELEAVGCSFKDWGFEKGLVDFPAVIDGKKVLLCWRSDEPSITHYHAPDAGFAGRKPIPPKLLRGE
jgi:hypothetical protein